MIFKILMDKRRIIELVSETAEKYNQCTHTLAPLENWVNSFKGNGGEEIAVNLIYDIIKRRNGKPSSFMPCIREHQREILSNELCDKFNIPHEKDYR